MNNAARLEKGYNFVKKYVVLVISIAVLLCVTSCGNRLNPKWYPRGVGKDTVYT